MTTHRTREQTAVPSGNADERSIVAHPDGFYWIADRGRQEFGPFATAAAAAADQRLAEEAEPAPAETLAQAQEEIGINGYLDPDTGAPAEGVATRTEQH